MSNYRGLNIEIDDLKEYFLIFGKNDTGKTNFCTGIRKVLELNARRKRFDEFDSTNCNKLPITIEIRFVVSDLTQQQKSNIGKFLDKEDGITYLDVLLKSTFNNDINLYEDELFFGNPKKDIFSQEPYRQNTLDRILDVIYIEPNYKIDDEKKQYFKYHDIKKIEDETDFSATIKVKIDELEEELEKDKIIKRMSKEINDFASEEADFFEGINFKFTPNITMSNLLKSLDIKPVSEKNELINNMGDGKTKILSMFLNDKAHDSEKIKIFIAEEPENHLYPILQMGYIDLLKRVGSNQLIVTTHSPKIINLNKIEQLVKFYVKSGEISKETFAINKGFFEEFGALLNLEISEMLFYDKVLLVEGYSEKYFYDQLLLKDSNFRKKIINSKLGIFSINGAAFGKTKLMLESLGIDVFIKTDNDITKVPKRDEKRYTGLLRCISLLTETQKADLLDKTGLSSLGKEVFTFNSECDVNSEIEDKMSDICDWFKMNHIYISSHKTGFEGDLASYLGDQIEAKDIEFLKDKKLYNLHDLLLGENIDIKINDSNKDNILVRFAYEL